jgi:hypothetical protein
MKREERNQEIWRVRIIYEQLLTHQDVDLTKQQQTLKNHHSQEDADRCLWKTKLSCLSLSIDDNNKNEPHLVIIIMKCSCSFLAK